MTEVAASGRTTTGDQPAEPDTGPPAAAPGADERLRHRGPFQRLLATPEIGALIGAVAIWAFFWAVTAPFGVAAGTANWLDVAATLGIMAVVVSMLMIGGEFDLSSGTMTGATGILVILLVKDVGERGGLGLNLWIALPVSLAIALAIGWFNGLMVEKTSLPSFIVTLGTFFVVRGAKLGFSKLTIDNIQVGRIDEGEGYEFWRKVFASEWARNEHTLSARDVIYNQFLVIGGAMAVLAFFELAFRRRTDPRSAGLALVAAGAGVATAGYVLLHRTDGAGANYGLGALTALGALVGVVGLARWRYQPAPGPRSFAPGPAATRLAAIGLALVVAATVAAAALDSTADTTVFLLFTEQGLRAILYAGLLGTGMVFLTRAALSAGPVSRGGRFSIQVLTVAALVATAFFIRSEATSRKFRAELFTVILLVALALAAWALVSLLFRERIAPDPVSDRLGRLIATAGIGLAVVGAVVRLLFTTEAELAGGVAPATFSVRILWFLAVALAAAWTLGRTRFGSWTFAVGGNKEAARQVGVPAARTKTQLFMIVSAGAWLVGMLLAFRLNTIQASTGNGEEFEYIIAAVVGGNLLTGGYGSAIGGAIGALIMAMSTQGIPFAGWNSDWRWVFLGVTLLLAVIANNLIRTRAQAARR